MTPPEPTDAPDRLPSRKAVVARLRDRLLRDSLPRLTVLTIVLIAGGCAFLFSVATLAAGLHSMAARYGLASLTGYVSFALLLRAWVAMRKGVFDLVPDLPIPDLDLGSAPATGEASRLFMGGRSGGGGSTGAWTSGSGEPPVILPVTGGGAARSTGGRSGARVFDALDSDIGWRIVAAAALVLAAAVVAGFVVYSAPTLLAEVAIDAGVMTTVYARMRRHELGHWTGAVWRHTWLPAVVIVVFMSGAGYLLQQAAPEARSIGGVVRAVTER